MNNKELESAIKKLEKKHGKGVIMDFKTDKVKNVEFWSSGIDSLDKILGGGIPLGRIIEIYGAESSGKTTLALHVAKTFQANNLKVAYLDVENAFDPVYAKEIGVDLDELVFSQPDWGEQALDIIDAFVNAGVNLVIVDSVAGLVPKAELEGDAGDAVVGKVARLMSQAIRRLSGPVSEHKCCLVFINQVRAKIGGMAWGPQTTTPGGFALRFGASIRLEVARKAKLKNSSGSYIGIRVVGKTVKNKVASPFQECEFDIIFGRGVVAVDDKTVFENATKLGILEKDGKEFSFEGEVIGEKKEVMYRLSSEEEFKKKLIEAIKEVSAEEVKPE